MTAQTATATIVPPADKLQHFTAALNHRGIKRLSAIPSISTTAPVTALDDRALAEIGRCVVHHTLFLSHLDVFVGYVGRTVGIALPRQISSSVAVLQAITTAIRPWLSDAAVAKFNTLQSDAARFSNFIELCCSGTWGTGRERGNIGCSSFPEAMISSATDLRSAALEMSATTRSIGDVRQLFDECLSTEGKHFRSSMQRALSDLVTFDRAPARFIGA